MGIISFNKFEKQKSKKGCSFWFWIIAIIFVFYLLSGGEEDKENSSENKNSSQLQETDKYKNISLEEKYKDNFIAACISCNMDAEKISYLQKQDNWQNGERYSFIYKDVTHEVYFLDNGTVNSINYSGNNDIKLYEYGYESLDINDFLITTETYASLQIAAEKVVKLNLNYPDTADFNWFTTGYCVRYYDYYIVGCEFTAKNAFGIAENHSFRIDCILNDEGSDFIYYELDGNVMSGATSIPEIKKVPVEEIYQNEEVIKLSYGTIGSYGKEDVFDEEKHIRYYIPSGKYKVTTETRGSGFFIETVELHKEDGFDTATIIQKIVFSNIEENYEIEIKEGECISLIINSILKFEPITD